VCDGFPSPSQVPPTGTPKPRCAPRRRGFTYDSVPNFSGNLDFVPCLFTLAIMAAGHHFDLPYSVELWDEGDTRVEELIALTGDYNVARAAYQEAIKQRAGRIVTLRQKTRVLADIRRQT
jgi:hypothetical protein